MLPKPRKAQIHTTYAYLFLLLPIWLKKIKISLPLIFKNVFAKEQKKN